MPLKGLLKQLSNSTSYHNLLIKNNNLLTQGAKLHANAGVKSCCNQNLIA